VRLENYKFSESFWALGCASGVSERVRVTRVMKTERGQPTAFLATLSGLRLYLPERERKGGGRGEKEFGNTATSESITAFR